MNKVWIIDRIGCNRFIDTERGIKERHSYEINKIKTVFASRKDAEDYVRPIVAKAFSYLISDMKANDTEKELEEEIKIYQERGWKEIRCEGLKDTDSFYELYGTDTPRTVYVVPCEHEYDRIGHFFVSIIEHDVY